MEKEARRIKRNRQLSEARESALKPHNKTVLTWLCVVHFSPDIKKCVNKDVVKQIVKFIPYDFTTIEPYCIMKFDDDSFGTFKFKWVNQFNGLSFAICHECCLPCDDYYWKISILVPLVYHFVINMV